MPGKLLPVVAQATKISIPTIPIMTIPLSNNYVTLDVLVANTGSKTIAVGTLFIIAENGLTAVLDTDLESGQQAVVSFSSSGSNNPVLFSSGQYTIYAATTGVSAVNTVPSTTDAVFESAPVSVNVSENVTFSDHNAAITEGRDGSLFIVWDSDQYKNEDHIFTVSAGQNEVWSPDVRISVSQTNTYPTAVFDGTRYGVAWTLTNPSGVEHIFVKESFGGVVWSEKHQAENEANNNRQPSMIVDNSGVYWLVWSSGDDADYDLKIKNATNWLDFDPQPAHVVNVNSSMDSFPSLIQDSNGTYWIAFYSDRSGIDGIWLTSSDDGIDWVEPWQLNVTANANRPSLFQDNDGTYWIAYDADGGNYSHIWLMSSSDGVSWSDGQRISDLEVIEQKPFLTQVSNGIYWLAFESVENNTRHIYVRGSTNVDLWYN